VHSKSHTLDENKNNNIAHSMMRNKMEVKLRMACLITFSAGNTECTKRTKTGSRETNKDHVHCKRSLLGELETQKLQTPSTKLLKGLTENWYTIVSAWEAVVF